MRILLCSSNIPMSTYSDICSNYTSDPQRYPASVQEQLLVLADYIYFLGRNGNGDPFDLASKTSHHGVVPTTEQIEDPSYSPNVDNAVFFTQFAEGDLIIKAVESKLLFDSNTSGGGGASTTTSTYHSGVQKTSLLVAGDFVDFGVPTIVDGVRSFETVVPVCYLMILIGNLEFIFLPPVSEGPSDTYGTPPLVLTPAIPSDITPDDFGWFADEEPDIRIPYWIVPGEGSSQTLPCISPRKLLVKQWGFLIDLKTTNSQNKRSA